jgi:hypothetical protein
LAKTPTMPAATLAERVGWSGSASLFRAKVAAIRPEYAAPDPADRLVHEAWEAAVDGVQLQSAADKLAQTGDDALLHAVQTFGKGA